MAEKKLDILKEGKKWVFSLIGKPLADNSGVKVKVNSSQETQEPTEDSVANDIKMFKDFAKKSFDMTKKATIPFAKKGASSVTDTARVVSTSVDNKFIKNLVRLFVISFFVIILIFITIYLFKMLGQENNPVQIVGVSPTPVTFSPYKPSVYAEDLEILVLEEKINILEKEIMGVDIKEGGINPPKLDYNIKF